MGVGWSRASLSRAWRKSSVDVPEIDEKDVLTLCEDGDLVLFREQVVNSLVRVAIDRVVAHDIAQMQHGTFPNQRQTALPAWTSCGLLLRRDGVLQVLEVDIEGVRLAPFSERVSKCASRQDRVAIRRIQHVRDEAKSSFLRFLTLELGQLLPLRWRYLNEGSAVESPDDTDLSLAPPSSPRTHVPSLETLQSFKSKLARTPVVSTQLFQQTQVPAAKEAAQPSPSSSDPSSCLATAVVRAVYEQLGLVSVTSTPVRLSPSCFWSRCESAEHVTLTPDNALGQEMRLRRNQQGE
ncbi:hypothetical protein Poli38472_013985 [Pythium oligandrum]|uniref:Uncharacterized protein n=1 Tax=Pythium oligandrum TaxID=41045 RepID=A0A8K1FQK0_PYTOL|nr:hypothetical protein Poli38472_013985 [Pythium oligandrum]|eukprot:TMW66673.1 hypothetical protein Poli38472_013985 [Pythium oligandrum]